jgi:hypothetical protein
VATRQELQQQLADVDRQINSELSKTKLPELRTDMQFPLPLFILAAICFAWWAIGAQIPVAGEYHPATAKWVMYAGCVLVALGALRTLQWLMKRNPKGDAGYLEATTRVRELQQQRREIQRQIKELDQ